MKYITTDGVETDVDVDSSETVFGVPCTPNTDGSNSGDPVDISLAYTSTSGALSFHTAPQTFICANVPSSPDTPRFLVRTLDLLLLEWDPPSSDGGSPILGYAILMKTLAESEFTMVYNGT